VRSIDISRNWCFALPHRKRGLAFIVLAIASFAVSMPLELLAQDEKQHQTEQSCLSFVQQFYTWYFGRSMRNEKSRSTGPSWDEVLLLRPQVLSPELRELLKADLAASRANSEDIVGLDWDPFLATQDPSSKFEVQSASLKNGHCYAVVNGIEHGKKHETVVPELAEAGAMWTFVNFHYKDQPPQDENLIGTLKLLRDERKKAKK
jgi:hypothetical protein